MRIMWQSNAPWTSGGYGNQTALIVPRLIDRLGHEAAISAFYGLDTGKLNWRGIDIFPRGFDAFGNDIAAANAHQFRADILLTHQDAWAQRPAQLQAKGMRWVPWMPIDSDPLAPQIALRIKDAYQAIALSRFGQRMAAQAGLDLPCVVQGIDTNVFTPASRREAREQLGWPQDAFIAGMVAHNRGYPSRKAYPQQLEAFGQFYQRHRDAMIYLHCFGGPEVDKEAPPLAWHLERYGAMDAAIWANPFDLNVGYSTEQMVLRFRAFDVLLSVSMSEGFGIPIIEAQSCGVPVVTGDWTAMPENTYAGWMVAQEDSEPWPMSPLECFWRLPHISAIVEQLEAAYSVLQNHDTRATLAETGRAAVVAHHDQDMLIDTAWCEVLSNIAQHIADERVPFHKHTWASFGYPVDSGLVARCQVRDCPAEVHVNGVETVYPAGMPLTIDGVELIIEDDPNGGVRHEIAQEITRVYHLDELTFQPGDVVLDIGAHVGVVSCYLAKKWPQLTVYAFEPIPANYKRLVSNIVANGLTNIISQQIAVTANGRTLILSGDPNTNTGHYSAFAERGPVALVCDSVSLLSIIRTLPRVALLKLDCEGAEYEILHSLGREMGRVQALAMEVHENDALLAEHDSSAALVHFVRLNIPWVRASVIRIPDREDVPV